MTFPAIGAFEVIIGDEVIFSKKKTNAWPNFGEIADKVYFRIHGEEREGTGDS